MVNKELLDLEAHNQKSQTAINRFYGVDKLFGTRARWQKSGCGDKSPILDRSIFGFIDSNSSHCAKVTFNNKSLEVFFAPGPGQELKMIAHGDFKSQARTNERAITVFLPASQTVFTKIPQGLFLSGEETNTNTDYVGQLEIIDTGKKFPLKINISPKGVHSTVIDGSNWFEDTFELE